MEATEAIDANMTHNYHINERMTKDASVAACDHQPVRLHVSKVNKMLRHLCWSAQFYNSLSQFLPH